MPEPTGSSLRRLLLATATLAGGLAAGSSASAMGLGAAASAVPIGHPLEFAVPVRLESDETLTPECAQAEVQFGERNVPVSLRLRQGPGNTMVVRLSTTAAVDEPIVSIRVTAGCVSRVSRRYVVFADPAVPAPATTPPAAQLAPAALPPASVVTAQPPSGGPSLSGTPPTGATTGTSGAQQSGTMTTPSGASTPSGAAASPAARGEAPAASARSGASRTPGAHARTTTASAQARRGHRAARPPRPPKVVAAAPMPAPEPRARLTLEPAEPEPTAPATHGVEEALAAVAEAASQARAAAQAASAAEARIAELERSVARARTEAQARQAEADGLRLQMRESQQLPWWSYALFAFSVLMALAAAWLAWRMRGMQRTQEIAWARATAMSASSTAAKEAAPTAPPPVPKETSPLPLITSELTQPAALHRDDIAAREALPAQVPTQAAAPRSVPAEEPELPQERTRVLPPTARVEEASPRDVSIEELIDVDQQAEFFIAIGQDHAAIDLLVTHLRQTGGGSPLTYLKLMDIYRRLEMQEEFERTRSRFNHRFNAYAPEWGEDPQRGRSLEDYEGVLPRLEAAWPRPLDAMAELEALLFRKSRGELFDLSAYREVLFLYSLARDLHDRDSGERDNVDLLLPLNPSAAGVAPMVGDSRATTDVPLDDHPTAPLDLDLTPHLPTPSIFDDGPPPTMQLPRKR